MYTEAVPQLDFYFINGEGMDGVVREYRRLTGKASMLPRWAFGYLQSQERYESQKEICQVAKEYRGVVLVWMVLYWTGVPGRTECGDKRVLTTAVFQIHQT